MVAVLFVCTGNICRSPSAHGVFLKMLADRGLTEQITVDSAGTHAYHVGEPPDERSAATALRRGYDLSALRARKVAQSDFQAFDFILTMDDGHYNMLRAACPPEYRDRIQRFMDYAEGFSETEMPDPYYGGAQGFDRVLDMVESGCDGLLQHVMTTSGERFHGL